MDHLPSKLLSQMVLFFQARKEMLGWKGSKKESQSEKDFILNLTPKSR